MNGGGGREKGGEGERRSLALAPPAMETGPVLQSLGGVSLSCWTQDPFADEFQRFALEVKRRLPPVQAARTGRFCWRQDRRVLAAGFLVDGAETVVRSDRIVAAERFTFTEVQENRSGFPFFGARPSGHVAPLPATPLLPARVTRPGGAGAAHVRGRFVDGRRAAHIRTAFDIVKDFR